MNHYNSRCLKGVHQRRCGQTMKQEYKGVLAGKQYQKYQKLDKEEKPSAALFGSFERKRKERNFLSARNFLEFCRTR